MVPRRLRDITETASCENLVTESICKFRTERWGFLRIRVSQCVSVLTGRSWRVRGRFLSVHGRSSAACSSCSASERAGTAARVQSGC